MYIPMYIFKFDSKANKFNFVPELDIFNPQCYLQVKLHLLAINRRHCLICIHSHKWRNLKKSVKINELDLKLLNRLWFVRIWFEGYILGARG